MKVLITGGAGFIGSHLTDYLLDLEYSVLVIDNFSSGKKKFISHNLNKPKFEFIDADLVDIDKIAKIIPSNIDTIFHLAANSDIMRGEKNPEIDYRNTNYATFNLLQVMRKKSIRKLFYLSGSGVYGDVKDFFVDENFGPLNPISMYGATKLAAEAMISAFSHLYGIRSWILRPANIIGPRLTHGVVFDFIKKLKKDPRKLQILGDGKQSKSYLYIDDIINAISLVWRNAKKQFNIFNVSSASFISVLQIAKIVIKEMKLQNVSLEFRGGERGFKGDVPIMRLKSELIGELGWQCNYNSFQAVQKTVQANPI